MKTIIERFNEQVKKTDDCWIWLGRVDKDGYGLWDLRRQDFNNGKRESRAPRISHMLFIGPIPKGMTVDHLCRNRICVNPNHLEAVTPKVNTLRGEGPAAKKARQTHCKRGHRLSGRNLGRHTNGGRYCRTCNGRKVGG